MSERTEDVFNPFPGNSYDTPDQVRSSLFDWLLLRTRASFYIRNFYVFYRSGKACRQGVFTQNMQTANSLDNFRIIESCGGKFHLRGLDNSAKSDSPVVIIGNHMSLLETAVLHAFLRPRRDFCFVIKQQLFDVPYFGDIMRHLNCIGVGRTNPRDDFRAVIEEGAERLKAGKSVVVFPQASRSAVFHAEHFNTIGVKLAKAAGVPIVPLALRTDFLENGTLIKDLGPIRRKKPIHFEFGEPIAPVTGNGKAEQAEIVEFITSRLRDWGCEVK